MESTNDDRPVFAAYCFCACRDCFETVIGIAGETYCDECDGHCGPENSTSTECQKPIDSGWYEEGE